MSNSHQIIHRLDSTPEDILLICKDQYYSSRDLLVKTDELKEKLENYFIPSGSVIALVGDYSPLSIAALLYFLDKNCIVIPLTEKSIKQLDEYSTILNIDLICRDQQGDINITKLDCQQNNPELIIELQKGNKPGLIFFSSGSSGKPKAILHDFSVFIQKYHNLRDHQNDERMLAFLLFDHIGGVNSMMHALHTKGFTLVVPESHDVEYICSIIEKYSINILPTSPSFLNLLFLTDIHKNYDLSSLKLITYGTEVMPEQLLAKILQNYPHIKLKQTYGLSEVGILPTKSVNTNSLWMQIGNQEHQVRVRNSMLEVKSKTSMLGYLNAASPFTEDGWFMTGDLVEENNGVYRILGRASDIINVGGLKVYPSEIENHILTLDNIEDAVVYGEKHPLLGEIVCAKVKLFQKVKINDSDVRKEIKLSLLDKMPKYMVPQKILIEEKGFISDRFKKNRK